MKSKDKLNSIAYALNGILFLMGGITLIDDGKLIFAAIQVLASILNIMMVLKIRKKGKIEKLNHIILAMNIVVCISVAVDYILANKSYIQFVWIFAALLSLVALILQMKRKKTLPN
ncbi:MAG: hypothetical protein Mars2KO_07570 [Maribacter sp.]